MKKTRNRIKPLPNLVKCYLDNQTFLKLCCYSDERKKTQSEILRQALHQYLKAFE